MRRLLRNGKTKRPACKPDVMHNVKGERIKETNSQIVYLIIAQTHQGSNRNALTDAQPEQPAPSQQNKSAQLEVQALLLT